LRPSSGALYTVTAAAGVGHELGWSKSCRDVQGRLRTALAHFIFEFPCITSLQYIINQQDATLAVLCLLTICSTCFGRPLRPSSGAL